MTHLYDTAIDKLDKLSGKQLYGGALTYALGCTTYATACAWQPSISINHTLVISCLSFVGSVAVPFMTAGIIGKGIGRFIGALTADVRNFIHERFSENPRAEKLAQFRENAVKTGKLIGITGALAANVAYAGAALDGLLEGAGGHSRPKRNQINVEETTSRGVRDGASVSYHSGLTLGA